MQVIRAAELFNNINNINIPEFENTKNIEVDFEGIKNIDLKGITTLLNLQKVALLNKKSIFIKNLEPGIGQILEVTGLNKTFSNVASNPLIKR